MKEYKPMSARKVHLYFFLSDRCPIGFVKRYVDSKLQIEMEYTLNEAISAIKDGLKRQQSSEI